jgi:hypothetical protein
MRALEGLATQVQEARHITGPEGRRTLVLVDHVMRAPEAGGTVDLGDLRTPAPGDLYLVVLVERPMMDQVVEPTLVQGGRATLDQEGHATQVQAAAEIVLPYADSYPGHDGYSRSCSPAHLSQGLPSFLRKAPPPTEVPLFLRHCRSSGGQRGRRNDCIVPPSSLVLACV